MNGKRRIIWNKAKIGEILNIRKILEITIKLGVKGNRVGKRIHGR